MRVVALIKSKEDVEVFGNLKAICREMDWSYHTLARKGGDFKYMGFRIVRTELKK
jgi:hypothetical protein